MVQKISIESLLSLLSILVQKRIVILINNVPDYDISKYQGSQTADYFFRNSWNYAKEFDSVCDVKFVSSRIFHDENLESLRAHDEFRYEQIGIMLQRLYDSNPEQYEQTGFDIDEIDEFKVRKIRVSSIDNNSRLVWYEGIFLGDSSSIDPVSWRVASVIEATGVNLSISSVYESLLSESYLLYRRGDFRLSYFLAYAGFESFINAKLNKTDEPGRLKDDLNVLYKTKFTDLNRHPIYTSCIGKFDQFTRTRNTIAHGRTAVSVKSKDAEEIIHFALTLIAAFEYNALTFADLRKCLIDRALIGR